MKLGSLELPTDLILAPMMDVMTPSFRQLIRDYGGVGLIVTPMVFVQQIAFSPKTVAPLLETVEHERPAGIQIVASGRNDDFLKKTLEFLESYQFDVLDINAGCPAFHTMKSGGGGSLIKDLSDGRLQNILNLTTKFSSHPVSLKTRLGYDNNTTIFEVSKMAENAGMAYLTIHGRMVSQNYGGTVNIERIAEVKQQLNIPVVGNGDVKDFNSYRQMKDVTGCEAVMIGRAAMGDPAIFQKINTMAQSKGEIENAPDFNSPPLLEEIRTNLQQIEKNIEGLSRYWNNDRFKLAELRRLAIWWIKGIPGHKKARMVLSRIQDLSELKEFIFSEKIEQVMRVEEELPSDLESLEP